MYLLFSGNKVVADGFKDDIIPSLKAKSRLQPDHEVILNQGREKVKPRCKLSYKVFNEKYGYDTLIEIFPFPTLLQLTKFIAGIKNCVTVICK